MTLCPKTIRTSNQPNPLSFSTDAPRAFCGPLDGLLRHVRHNNNAGRPDTPGPRASMVLLPPSQFAAILSFLSASKGRDFHQSKANCAHLHMHPLRERSSNTQKPCEHTESNARVRREHE